MKPYVPQSLPLDAIDWASQVTLIGRGNAELARYDGMLQSVINPGVLLSPLTVQEAVLSSRIEGTQASMEEVLEYEADPDEDIEPARRADIQEITNYRKAIAHAVDQLERKPLSLNLVKDLHAILMDSVRGRDKAAGQFRRTQNYIAPPGQPIANASYVPPEWQRVEPAMHNWEQYLHADEKDPLVQLAVAKAQFELIHPFLDGNGRLGRMLIPLFLLEKGLLSSPMFYMSAYFEQYRDVYYGRLQAISHAGDWDGWIDFFLTVVAAQAVANARKVRTILALYERMKQEIPAAIHSQYAVQATDALFDRPIFTRADFVERTGISVFTTGRILSQMKESGIIHESRPHRGRQPAILTFPDLLNIVQE